MEMRFDMRGRPLSLPTNKDKHSRSVETWGLFGVKEWEEKQGWAHIEQNTC